jgi:hypothetical protein
VAHHVPARLSPAEGRKFGLQVGLAFLAIAVFAWWRGRSGAAPWLGGLGALLVIAGLAMPGRLGPLYRAWMGLALLLSKVTTPIFMAIIYFAVITPIGLLLRVFGRDPLADGGRWMARPTGAPDPKRMERQF